MHEKIEELSYFSFVLYTIIFAVNVNNVQEFAIQHFSKSEYFVTTSINITN